MSGQEITEDQELPPDEVLWEGFVSCRLSPQQWTHLAHVRIGFLHLRQDRFDIALEKIRSRIQQLNSAHGTPEAIDRGYHETITRAFLQLIAGAMAEHAVGSSLDFCHSNPGLMTKTVLLDYYSRERIMSAEAKAGFVEPDLKPLPGLVDLE